MDSRSEYYKIFLCELILFIIELLIVVLVVDEISLRKMVEEKRTLIGWLIIALFTLVIVIQIIIDMN